MHYQPSLGSPGLLLSATTKKKQASGSKLRNLAKLISWLDGYAALKCVDPMKIERLAKSEGESIDEVARVWSDVREDVRDIATLPGSSSEVVKISKYLNISRMAITLMGVGIILVFLVMSSLFSVLSNPSVRLGILIAVAGAYYVVFFSYFLLSRKLNKLVIGYYEKHQGEVAKQRRRIKIATQRLIDVLAMRIRASSDELPEKYKLRLFHDDYSNIRVLEGDNSTRKKPDAGQIIAVVKGRTISPPENK